MARTPASYCAICTTLFQKTLPKPDVVGLPRFGSAAAPAMRRLYTRPESRTYEGIGWICPEGHVSLDAPSAYGNGHHVGDHGHHLVTPTIPRKVLCLLNGELVATDVGAE